MGQNQSKSDMECRREMRRQIKQAKREKRRIRKEEQRSGNQQLATVVEMDKLGNIGSDHDHQEAGNAYSQNENMIQPGSSLALDTGHVDNQMILVAQTRIEQEQNKIDDDPYKERKGSDGDRQLFQVVDKVEKSNSTCAPKRSMASSDDASVDKTHKSNREFHEDYEEGDEDSSDYDSDEDADEMDAMQTLQMTRDNNGSISQDFRSGSMQTDARHASTEITLHHLSSFGGGQNNTSPPNQRNKSASKFGNQNSSSSRKQNRDQSNYNSVVAPSQNSCNSGCMFPSFGKSSTKTSQSIEKRSRRSKRDLVNSVANNQDDAKKKSKTARIGDKKDQLHQLVKKDQRKRHDDFEKVRKHRMDEKQSIKIQRMKLSAEQVEAIRQNQESCCDQCNLPVPLLCWRYKIKYNLDQGRIQPLDNDNTAATNEENKTTVQEAPRMTRQPAKPRNLFTKFSIIDGWRDKVLEFLENESGTFSGTDRQWVSNFYDYEVYMTRLSMNEQQKDSTGQSKQLEMQLQSSMQMRQSYEISQTIAKDRLKMSIETGQSILMIDEKIHELVLFISKQLSQLNHPIRMSIEKFKTVFHQTHMVLLCRQTDISEIELSEPLVEVPMDEKMDYAENVITKAINMFVEAILLFYELENQIKSFHRSYELFENLVTNLILEGEVYFLMFNLTSSWLEPQQRALRRMMFSREILENHLPIQSLTALPQFQFDVNHRNIYEKDTTVEDAQQHQNEQTAYYKRNDSNTSSSNGTTMLLKSTQQTTLASSGTNTVATGTAGIKIVGMGNNRPLAASEDKKKSQIRGKGARSAGGSDAPYVYEGQPYSMAISELQKLSCLESPMSKLEWIYNCCTRQVSKEIDLFWQGYNIPTKKLFVDPDNLQGIIIFIVSRLKNPQIITEIHFIKKFVPKGIKRLGRFYHCEMVGAACSYLLETEQQTMEKERQLNETRTKKQKKVTGIESCYDVKKKPAKKGMVQGRTSFQANCDEASGTSSSYSSGDEEDGTMQDNVSWAELAFGQSMRSTTSHMLVGKQNQLASTSSFQPAQQANRRPRQQTFRQSQPRQNSGSRSRSRSPNNNNRQTLPQGCSSPVFASIAKQEDPVKATDEELEVTPVWIEGTEEDLAAKRPTPSPNQEDKDEFLFDGLTLREDDQLRQKQEKEQDDVSPEVLMSNSLMGDNTSTLRRTCRQRSDNLLLDQINQLRHKNYGKIEETHSVYFQQKAANKFVKTGGGTDIVAALASKVAQKNRDPYAAAQTPSGKKKSRAQLLYNRSTADYRKQACHSSSDGDEGGNDEQIQELSPTRAHSVIEQDDNFFFQNNLVLKSDLRARLGVKKVDEMAKKKGYNQARCISEL